MNRHVGVKDHHVGPGDGAQRAIVEPRDPRHERAIVEPQDQLHSHLDASAAPDDDARQIGRVTAEGHEVHEGHRAVGGLEVRLEDQRPTTIVPRYPGIGIARRDLPPPVFRSTEDCGEACARVEAWPAEPIDRSIPRHERRRLAVADERVVLDPFRHAR